MTWLRFNAGFDVPVEVRTTKMHLVEATTASRRVQVEEGRTYVVTAKLPSGESATEVVRASGADMEVDLGLGKPEIADAAASKRALRAMRPRFGRGVFSVTLESMGGDTVLRDAPFEPAAPSATMSFWRGNVLAGSADEFSQFAHPSSVSEERVELRTAHLDQLAFVQCAHSNLAPVNIALPVSAAHGCSIVIRRETDRYWVEVYPEHQHANLLLGYAQNRLAQNEAALAEKLLLDKFEDPIGAAVGAYSLLRVGELERLHDWTANLMNSFEWLPDGAAVRGEHCARAGKHDEALAAFLAVVQRGLPIFSDGVRLTHERLRFYGEIRGNPEAQKALEQLKPFVRHIDFTKPVTTFEGNDPNRPGGTAPRRDAGGMDVASLFHS